jgi:hypothetical protein
MGFCGAFPHVADHRGDSPRYTRGTPVNISQQAAALLELKIANSMVSWGLSSACKAKGQPARDRVADAVPMWDPEFS